jgi:uncharacterized membrane protein YesL
MNPDAKKKIGDFFSYEGGFYDWTGKAFDILALSFFWLLGCLPIVTIGASCTAAYYAAAKSIRRDIGTVSGDFWKSYRQNLKPSLPLWLVMLLFGFVFLLNIGIVGAKLTGMPGTLFTVVYAACFVALLAAACFAFPALSRFEMPTGWIIKLSLYLTVRHLPVTVLLLALLAGCYFAVYRQLWLILFLPGLLALVSSFFVDPILDRHMPKENDAQNHPAA